MKRDVLGWVALAAAIVGTASAEYELARACGFGQFVAGTVPAALDVYAVRAYRQHRDGLAVLAAMVIVNALSHLVTAGLIPVDVPLVVAVSALAPLVMWRVHALHRTPTATPTPTPTEADGALVEWPAAPHPLRYDQSWSGSGTVPAGAGTPGYTPLPAPSTRYVGAFDKAPKERPPSTGVEGVYPRRELQGSGGSGGGVPDEEYGDGYVPEPVPAEESEVPTEPEDELTDPARKEFAGLLAEGRIPSIRQLRSTYSIGQPRAERIQRQLSDP